MEHVDTPSPIVLLDVVRNNIARMQDFATSNGVDLRPHVKTHKCLEIGRLQADAGARGITAGTLGEAETFAHAGFDDILLAYPIWPSGTKAARIRALAGTTRLTIGIDNPSAIAALAGAMGDEPDRLQILIEIDCGAHRSGASPRDAGELATTARKAGMRPVGVFTYPGHGSSSSEARRQAARDQERALTEAADSMTRAGVSPQIVSAGSTPTVEFSTADIITEVRPGEYVFYDLDNARLQDCSAEDIALYVAATVVSTWVPGQIIVDTGTKALGREGNTERGYGAVAGTDAVLTRLNEYHGYLATRGLGGTPQVGTVLPIAPNHVCPVVNNFDELLVLDPAAPNLQRWSVAARGRLS